MNTKYVFKDEDKYIGIDQASGGYPWHPDNVFQAEKFKSIEDALKYRNIFKESWKLYKITVIEEEINIENSGTAEYSYAELKSRFKLATVADVIHVDYYKLNQVEKTEIFKINKENAKLLGITEEEFMARRNDGI